MDIPMKKIIRLLAIALLGTWLVGCATPGVVYDDGKVARIKKDLTTEVELLDWFGPASTRTLGPDGARTMTWKFASAKDRSSRTSGRLEVRLGNDGKVIAYTASSSTR
jgi:hypothetical protein